MHVSRLLVVSGLVLAGLVLIAAAVIGALSETEMSPGSAVPAPGIGAAFHVP